LREIKLIFLRVSFVDILQILFSTRRFSKITPLRRSIGYPQMPYREGAKDAKLREVEIKSCFLLRATSRDPAFNRRDPLRAFYEPSLVKGNRVCRVELV
jgi:hypothetical protein